MTTPNSTTTETNDTTSTPLPKPLRRNPADGLLGQTQTQKNYRHKAEETPGDLLAEALHIDSYLSISTGLRVIASEIDLVADSIVHGEGTDHDPEIIEEVFAGIVDRLHILAEVDDRVRDAHVARIRELEKADAKGKAETSAPEEQPDPDPDNEWLAERCLRLRRGIDDLVDLFEIGPETEVRNKAVDLLKVVRQIEHEYVGGSR